MDEESAFRACSPTIDGGAFSTSLVRRRVTGTNASSSFIVSSSVSALLCGSPLPSLADALDRLHSSDVSKYRQLVYLSALAIGSSMNAVSYLRIARGRRARAISLQPAAGVAAIIAAAIIAAVRRNRAEGLEERSREPLSFTESSSVMQVSESYRRCRRGTPDPRRRR